MSDFAELARRFADLERTVNEQRSQIMAMSHDIAQLKQARGAQVGNAETGAAERLHS